ncbi:MAG: hypothetical protein ACREUE_17650 [Panacagrimonas sp.]
MTPPTVSARASVLADVLGALFERDRELAEQLSAAQRRLREVSERLGSPIADTIHQAFVDYQAAAERRRQLGADVGEAAVRLVDAMQADGFTAAQARRADVWALREGVYRPASTTARTVKGIHPRREPGS